MPAVGQSHQGGQSPVTHQQWLLDADLVTNIHKYIAGRRCISVCNLATNGIAFRSRQEQTKRASFQPVCQVPLAIPSSLTTKRVRGQLQQAASCTARWGMYYIASGMLQKAH
ncbi:TPA: hypothetical protein ACH3X2_001985 [Trebouxia sp. C0005]